MIQIRFNVAEMSAMDVKKSEYKMDRSTKTKESEALQTIEPFLPSPTDGKLPINKVSSFSYIFATWLSPLVWKMFRNRSEAISESDIWKCSDEEGLEVNTKRLIHLWKEELERYGNEEASFMRVWLRFIRTRNLVSICILSLAALATFTTSAFLLNQVISYLESEGNNLTSGICLTAAVLCTEVTRATALANLDIFSNQTGTRFRSGFMGIIYDKLLKMRTIRGRTNSQIINAATVDSYRIYNATLMIAYLSTAPVYVTIATVYSYILIGYWCFIAIAIFVFCYLGQAALSRMITSLRSKCVQYTDIRVNRIGEVLNNMKFIKMYAWEKPFNDALKDARKPEQKYLMYLALLNAVICSVTPVSPTIASVITITIYSAAGNTLIASTTFALLGTMNFLRVVLSFIPRSLRDISEAKVSFARIKRILLMDEHVGPSIEVMDKDNVIEIKATDFVWINETDLKADLETEKTKKRNSSYLTHAQSVPILKMENLSTFQLTNINFEVQKGKLIGICGSVGSGKSSLMSALLGRMIMKRGHLAVNGSIAYVAQQAWIFNASLKDNVLFGNDYDACRYLQAISCCGLDPDIRVLPFGDETEIGERGINLSGGQKQRVSLARAVYSNSDIFLLDDPLSALDVKVGERVFHACIKDVLKSKTVILVTHQLQYLKHCNEIFVMTDGRIEEKGHHQELLAFNGMYANMCRIFERTAVKPQNPDQTAESGSFFRKMEKNMTIQEHAEHTKQSEGNANIDKLVVSEEAVVGNIRFGTYDAYVQAAGGWLIAILVILVYFTASGSIVFSDWWLSQWVTNLSMAKQPTTVIGHSTARQANGIDNLSANATTWTRFNSTETSHDFFELITNFDYDTYFTVYIVSLVGIIALQVVQGFCLAKAAITASSNLYANCLDKVMKAPMFFFDSNPVGRILNRFSKDLDEGDVFLPRVTESFLRLFTLTFLSVAMATLTSPWIRVSVFPVTLVFALMKRFATVAIRQLKRLENVSRSPLISHINMTSEGLSTIVAYQKRKRFFEKLLRLGDNASKALFLFDASMQWVALRLDLAAGMITVSTTLILVLTKGMIAPASAGMILALYGRTIGTIQVLVLRACDSEARFTSVERLNEYAKTLIPESQNVETLADPHWPDKGTVTYSDVFMRYSQYTNPVLRSIAFDIRSKEKVGIVGRTGAGKSSLAAVLFRLNELCGGAIYVDGVDISKLHLNTLRSKISTITQEPVLFAGTIRYNVDPFSKYSDISIWEALEKVHMKKKILQSSEGLNIMIEENGENFSVGERQLICLARAVLRKSKILLLDEATANIDTSTDALIQETIRECFADCTVITIAHRLSTVIHSDKIIVLDSGQVIECGSPLDLISDPCSFLNSMINAQSLKIPSP